MLCGFVMSATENYIAAFSGAGQSLLVQCPHTGGRDKPMNDLARENKVLLGELAAAHAVLDGAGRDEPALRLSERVAHLVKAHAAAERTIAALQAQIKELRAEPQLPPVPTRPCRECGNPLDNLQGVYLMQGYGGVAEVCHRGCKERLEGRGYIEVGRAR